MSTLFQLRAIVALHALDYAARRVALSSVWYLSDTSLRCLLAHLISVGNENNINRMRQQKYNTISCGLQVEIHKILNRQSHRTLTQAHSHTRTHTDTPKSTDCEVTSA